MTPNDDIRGETPASASEGRATNKPARRPQLREIGPESEVRGGPEAPAAEESAASSASKPGSR